MMDNLAQKWQRNFGARSFTDLVHCGIISVPRLEQGRDCACVASAWQKEIAAALLYMDFNFLGTTS